MAFLGGPVTAPVRWLLSALIVGCAMPAAAQSNNWQQQQQRQQQDAQRQQQQEQMRRQQQDQMRQQQQEQVRQQMRQQQQEQMRQQMQQQMRQQQQDQMRSQMQQQARQQSQQQMRQQQQNEMRAQTQQQVRQQQSTAAREQMQEQQRQLQKNQRAQTGGQGTWQAANGSARGADRTVFSNGLTRLTRPLTPTELRRGFTGKLTADGRALVKIQDRIVTVPAARVGIRPRAANEHASPAAKPAAAVSGLSPQRQALVRNDLQKLVASASAGSGGGRRGNAGPANDNSPEAGRRHFGQFFKTSGHHGKTHDYANGWDFRKPVLRMRAEPGMRLCQWQVPGGRKGSHFGPCNATPHQLGIATHGDVEGKPGEVVPKIQKVYVVKPKDGVPVEMLAGTAAQIVDKWSMEKAHVPALTAGGAMQYFFGPDDLQYLVEE